MCGNVVYVISHPTLTRNICKGSLHLSDVGTFTFQYLLELNVPLFAYAFLTHTLVRKSYALNAIDT